MRMRRSKTLVLGLCGAVTLGLPTTAQATERGRPAHPPDVVQVVARGLDNPRGLDIAPDGSLWIAEAGRGGGGPFIRGGAMRDEGYGPTGAVTRVFNGYQRRVLTGLPSLAPRAATGTVQGDSAVGPSDISFNGYRYGLLSVGLGADPGELAKLPANGQRLGKIYQIDSRTGRIVQLADIADFERRVNPDGAEVDTNPQSVLRLGSTGYLADAGGNSLLQVTGGAVSTRAVFPRQPNPTTVGPPTYSAVPTAVTRGPQGSVFVGQLTGFPFPAGQAKVYLVRPGQQPQVHASGFTTITDLAYGRDGSLYVLQLTTNGLANPTPGPGRLYRVAPDGTRTELAAGRLSRPLGITLGHGYDRAVYVSNQGDKAGIGEVLRVPLPAESSQRHDARRHDDIRHDDGRYGQRDHEDRRYEQRRY